MGLRTIKDKITSSIAKRELASKFERYGELQTLKIDSKAKTLTAEILLKGETESVLLHITAYHLVEDGNGLALVIDSATCSRAWAANLIADFVLGSAISLPGLARIALGSPVGSASNAGVGGESAIS